MSWKIDPSHSEINFTVRHMMISNVRGRFERFTGVIAFNPDAPENSSVEIQIEAASINTRDPQRDAHLRSTDFLNTDEFPYLTYKSKSLFVMDENRGRIIGDLTIRGVSREVALDVDYNGIVKSPWGANSAGFTAKVAINRKDWGLVWNAALESGGVLVSDEILINIDLEIVAEPELVLA